MTRYILRRILGSIVVLAIIVTISLWITRQAPSNPCLKEREANTCACLQENKLDRPVFPVYLSLPISQDSVDSCQFWEAENQYNVGPVKVVGFSEWGETQYFHYVFNNLLEGSLGPSMKNDRSVWERLRDGLPYTIQLGTQALLLAILLGVPAGLYAGLKQNTASDYATMTVAMIGVSVPNIVLGPLLIMLFAMNLGWFSPTGWDTWADSVLPTITLSLYYAAYIARLTRGGMLEMIRKDFIRTARAKGLGEGTVVFRHALKGAILPVISYLGPAFAAMLTGSIVIEDIFNVPGIGTYFVRSALNREYNMVVGTIMIYSTVLISLNLLVDILYTFVDPRVDYDD